MSRDFPINKLDLTNLERLAVSPNHAIILETPARYGADTLALALADMMKARTNTIFPTLKGNIDEINGSVSVESIRELQTYAKHKSDKLHAIIINKADSMTKSAQNAFLKLLEEPNENTVFILAVEDINKILPTVISRSQIIKIHRVSVEQSTEYINKLGITDSRKSAQILYLASGLPAEIKKLVTDDKYFTFRSETIKMARELLNQSNYEKIIAVSKLKDDREKSVELVNDFLLILTNTIKTKATIDAIRRCEKILIARDNILSGCNVRLNLLNAMI